MAQVTLEWLGLGCVKMTVKQEVGEVTILTDPFGPEEGKKLPRNISADILLLSGSCPAEVVSSIGGNPFVISHPGEYEAKGVFVYGIGAPKGMQEKKGAAADGTLFRIECNDLTLASIGCLGRTLTDAEYDRLADSDILLLPVGNQGSVLGAREAAEVMARIEPRVVIPTFFHLPGLARKLDPAEKFVKEAGIVPEKMEKVRLSAKDLPQEETKLFILNA